jgi:multidrug efflux system membrane fusion protein
MPTRQWLLILALPIIAVVACAGFYVSINVVAADSSSQTSAPAPAAVPVVAGNTNSGDVPIYLRGIGTVIAYNTVVVRSQVSGQIAQIAFTEGQTVKAGDLLAQIDPRPFQATLDQMQGQLARDEALLANSKIDLTRFEKLITQDSIAQEQVDTQRAKVAQDEATVKSDKAQVEAAQVQLDFTRLTSPIAGVTGIRQIDIGNIIHPTDTNGLVVVTQIEPISVIFTLPETDLPQIQQEIVKGPMTVFAYSQDDKTKLDEGKLGLVDNEILQATGTLRLKANFPNPAHRLWPGQLINVRLLLKTRPNGLTIAVSAVQQGPKGAYVYVIGPDEKVQMRTVTVAQISEGQALIDSGLQANEKVVVDGQYRLQPGALVRELHGKAAEEADLQSSVQKAIP